MPARVSIAAQPAQSMRVRGMLWAIAAAAGPILLIVVVALLANYRSGQASVESYGSTITAQLAALSAAPLVTHDRIDLNVITNNLADDPAIVNAAIYTLDDRLISTGGRVPVEATQSAASDVVFRHDITFEAQRVGYVRLVVDPRAIAPAGELWIFGAAVLGAIAAAFVGARLGARHEAQLDAIAERLARVAQDDSRASAETHAVARLAALAHALAPDPEPVAAIEETGEQAAPPYLFALNLFNQGLLPPKERDAMYAACEQRLARVLTLYKGKLVRLAGTGVLVLFENVDDDHAFSAICAALLSLRLTSAIDDERERHRQTRIGLRGGLMRLERMPSGLADEALLDELEAEVAVVVALSATAKDRTLAVDRALFESLLEIQRVQWTAIRSAITSSSDAGRFHYQIAGLAPNHESLLQAQTERLIAA